MKYILASILCLSLVASPSYALDIDRQNKQIDIMMTEKIKDTDYPNNQENCDDECNETPCQQECNENYQSCMDFTDDIYLYCGMIPEGDARKACHIAVSILQSACLSARDYCNLECYENGNAG
jgi:hypothetical protein